MANLRSLKINKVRIIGGDLRSRVIDFPDAEGLRPTPDRVRETLFNWLGQTPYGRTRLDLFAGSGAPGVAGDGDGGSRRAGRKNGTGEINPEKHFSHG